MPRTMLQVRIDALCHHLEQAQHPDTWKKKLVLNAFDVDDGLWDNAVEEVYNVAGALHRRLDVVQHQVISEEITELEGWRRYERVHAASEEVFRECLDLLGGLALRDRIHEERICVVADEYIKELASATVRQDSFSIPGIDVRLSSTMRRVAKMQFPEWTVWTLPLVAHEYGHVVIEKSGLKSYAAAVSTRFAEHEITTAHPDVLARLAEGKDLGYVLQRLASPDDVDDLEILGRRWGPEGAADDVSPLGPVERMRDVYEHQCQRVRVLLADALATLLAGPAYAYAALMLRLSPMCDQRQPVSDQERAATILATLRYMNEPVDDDMPLHGDIVDQLADYWRQSVAAARGVSVDDASPELDMPPPIDPADIHNSFKSHLVSYRRAAYERRHSQQAIRWSSAWIGELDGGLPTCPVPDADDHIRESLNAAWRARVLATSSCDHKLAAEAASRVGALGDVALSLCETIITQRGEARGGGDPGGGSNVGRAVRP